MQQERRQLQTLRFDINNLVETRGGGSKAEAKSFFASIEKMDFAIRQKDQATAKAAVVECQEKGNALLKTLA
jgi:photosystem II oxygen-evolving enhancer protein 3